VGLEGILRKKVVWATQFEHLNDKSELVEGDRLVHEVAVELNAVIGLSKLQTLIRESFLEKQQAMAISTLMREICVASFSEAADEVISMARVRRSRRGLLARPSIYLRRRGRHATEPLRCGVQARGVRRRRFARNYKRGATRGLRNAERFADQRYPNLRPEQFDKMMHRGMQLCHHHAGVMALSSSTLVSRLSRSGGAIAMPRHKAPERTMKTRTRANGLPVPYVELPLVSHASDRVALEELWVGPTADSEARAQKARALVQSSATCPTSSSSRRCPSAADFYTRAGKTTRQRQRGESSPRNRVDAGRDRDLADGVMGRGKASGTSTRVDPTPARQHPRARETAPRRPQPAESPAIPQSSLPYGSPCGR